MTTNVAGRSRTKSILDFVNLRMSRAAFSVAPIHRTQYVVKVVKKVGIDYCLKLQLSNGACTRLGFRRFTFAAIAGG